MFLDFFFVTVLISEVIPANVLFCNDIILQNQHGEPPDGVVGNLSAKINQLKKQIQAERVVSVKVSLQLGVCSCSCGLFFERVLLFVVCLLTGYKNLFFHC